jgi:hypothetical protein
MMIYRKEGKPSQMRESIFTICFQWYLNLLVPVRYVGSVFILITWLVCFQYMEVGYLYSYMEGTYPHWYSTHWYQRACGVLGSFYFFIDVFTIYLKVCGKFKKLVLNGKTQPKPAGHPPENRGSIPFYLHLYAAEHISSFHIIFGKYIATIAIWKYLPYVNIKK